MLYFFIIFYLFFFILFYYFLTLNNEIYIIEDIFDIEYIKKIVNPIHMIEYNDKFYSILKKEDYQELYKIIYENNILKNISKKILIKN